MKRLVALTLVAALLGGCTAPAPLYGDVIVLSDASLHPHGGRKGFGPAQGNPDPTLTSLGATLANVLVEGNSTGGTDLSFASGDDLVAADDLTIAPVGSDTTFACDVILANTATFVIDSAAVGTPQLTVTENSITTASGDFTIDASTGGGELIVPGSGIGSTEIGDSANASGTQAVCYGDLSSAPGDQSTANGRGSRAAGDSSAAYGTGADIPAAGIRSTALGSLTNGDHADTICLGWFASSSAANQATIGADFAGRGTTEFRIFHDAGDQTTLTFDDPGTTLATADDFTIAPIGSDTTFACDVILPTTAQIQFDTAVQGTASASHVSDVVTLTDASPIQVASLTTADDTHAGGTILYMISARDAGGETQTTSGIVVYSLIDDAGGADGTITEVVEVEVTSDGSTLTTVWTLGVAADDQDLEVFCQATSSLSTTTLTIDLEIVGLGPQAISIP